MENEYLSEGFIKGIEERMLRERMCIIIEDDEGLHTIHAVPRRDAEAIKRFIQTGEFYI